MTQFQQKEAGRARGMHGERRTVTVLFCDVAGSTAMAEQLDPEEWAEIMNDAFQHLTAPVEKYEGKVARLMGDAILAFFGAPVAHEDDPQRAILAGLDIVESIGPFREEIKTEYGLDFNVRIGINTGPVVVGEVGSDFAGEYTAMGDAVNVAARMEQTAAPGTVQVAENTHALVEPLFEFESLSGIEVKGKGEPVPAYRVISPKDTPGRLRGIEGLDAPLIGREHEVDTLRRIITEVGEGRGQIVCVVGDAGLGKSRLLAELRAEWEGQTNGHGPWTESRGISYETTRPYGQFQQRVRQLFGVLENDPPEVVREKLSRPPEGFREDLPVLVGRAMELLLDVSSEPEGQRPEGEAIKRELFDAVTNIWREVASRGPTVMVFDDMHWVDLASAELIQHLFQLTEELPVLFLCANRPERKSPAWQIKQLAEMEYPHRYTELQLSPLTDDESETLVSSLLTVSDLPTALQRMILEKTDGNPFFVEEVVRTLIESGAVVRDETGTHWEASTNVESIAIPENVQALITTRFDRLEEDVRSTLQMASVIGRSFYYNILELVSDTTSALDRQLSVLQRVELIREAARVPELEYAFRHELTREAAYNSILRRRSRQFHRRVGEAIEELFPDGVEEQASRLAHHFDEGRDFDKALKYYTIAADAAGRLYANVEANTLYARAIELAGEVAAPAADLVHLYTRNGTCLELLGKHDNAITNYEQLEELGRQRDDRSLELAGLLPQATVFSTYTLRFDPAKGASLSVQTLDLARQLEDKPAEAKALWNLMLVKTFSRTDTPGAIESGERSLQIAREHDLKEQLAYTLNDLSRVYFGTGRKADAWSALEESQELWRELGNMPMLGDNLQAMADGRFQAGEFDKSVELAEEALGINRSIVNRWGEAASLFALAPPLFERGEVSRSIDYLEEAVSLSEKGGLAAGGFARAPLAWMYGQLGHLSRALDLMRLGFERLETSEPHGDETTVRLMLLAVRSYLHTLNGDRAKAEADFNEAAQAVAETGTRAVMDYMAMSVIFGILIKGEVILAWGQYDELLTITGDALIGMREKGTQSYLPDVLRLQSAALKGLGRTDEAFEALTEARAAAERQGSRRALWPVLTVLAELEAERGNGTEADSLRHQAREIVEYISDHADSPELRDSFTSLPQVKSLLESG